MKTLIVIPFLALLLPALASPAASFKEAKVTQVVKQVSLLRPSVQAAPASPGDRVAGQTAVRTGSKSRTELSFPDQTLLRLGSNTHFSFLGKERDFDLHQGTAVLKTNKQSGGARFHYGGITAAITGSMATVATPPHGQAGFVSLLLYYGSAYLEVGGVRHALLPWQIAFVEVDKKGNPVSKVKTLYVDAPLAARTSNLVNHKEPVLKKNLARTRKELAANGILFDPSSNSSQDHIISRAASRPPPSDY